MYLNHQPVSYTHLNTLIKNVVDGEVEAAKKHIKELLTKISVLEAGDISAIKAKVLWIFAIIIRMATRCV